MNGRWWAFGLGLFYALLLFTAVLTRVFGEFDQSLAIFSICFIILSAWRLRHGLPSRLAIWAIVLLAGGLLLMSAQLVTLPFSLWSALPGRQMVVETFKAAQIPNVAMPFTIDPVMTRAAILYILPGVALFLGSLSLLPQHRIELICSIIGLAVVCAFIGMAQRFQGVTSTFNFFPESAADTFAKGTFFNRNFYAAQLYCSVPMVAALGVFALSGRNMSRFVFTLLLFVCFLALMAAMGASGSRGGLGLAMLGVLLSGVLVWSGRNKGLHATYTSRFLVPLIVIALLAVSQFGLVALLRIAQTDNSSDFRAVMAATSIEAIWAYFPFGSGFGSFVPVYKLFEHPDQVMPGFVNAAHNDWLQLALEGGLPMMVLMIAFVGWYFVASFQAWKKGTNSAEDLLLKAVSIVVFLLMLHSMIDYPLRTRALMGLFAICCGFLAYGVQHQPIKRKFAPKSQAEPMPDNRGQTRTTPYFVKKDIAQNRDQI